MPSVFLGGGCWKANASSLTCNNEVTSLEKVHGVPDYFMAGIFSFSEGDLSDFCRLQKCCSWSLCVYSDLALSLQHSDTASG